MSDREMIHKLILHGEKMRNYQKEYFKGRKKEILILSKRAEVEFDNVIYNAKQLVK